MEIKTVVTFFHEDEIAKMKILDSTNNIVVKDGKIFENLDFDYNRLKYENANFRKIKDDGKIGQYYFEP